MKKSASNSNLTQAKNAKNDEFYTQYQDIEKEVMAYFEYNNDVFRGKTILLPCDDPEWSNFTKFFAQNFERLGLKKLISTSYAPESKRYKYGYQPSLFEVNDAQFDETKTNIKGKIFTLTRDKSGDGKIDVDDLEWSYLQDDGDFRSSEVIALRNEADIIITNPPFSLFREFLAWIVEADKKFILIGSKNAITYKEVFPLIKEDKMWVGATSFNKDMLFISPEEVNPEDKPSTATRTVDGVVYLRSPSVWFTNLDHGRRHEKLSLMTMADNIKFNKHKEIQGKEYQKYDNYDAIEVPFTDSIPSDYDGVMGVPISFLDKYSPEQFEIIEMLSSAGGGTIGSYPPNEKGKKIKDKRPIINGKNTYARILIRHKKLKS
ncbi:MAG: adenine-specific methyltransferase EcoRI family protein [Spirochaetota bacterium]|nr:adenine-specific methyltransferase EcoRI family protein [Spirochaetota bacterium]